jgi:glycosyltransferase involved in cell wall biosynthesis
VEPDDRAALSRSIRAIADDPDLRARLGRAARVRAEQHFDGRATAARVVDIVTQCATGRSSTIDHSGARP